MSDKGTQFALNMARRMRDQRDDLADHLRLILPMAKGYAHEHPVGRNQAFVNDAVKYLATIPTREQQVKNIMDQMTLAAKKEV